MELNKKMNKLLHNKIMRKRKMQNKIVYNNKKITT